MNKLYLVAVAAAFFPMLAEAETLKFPSDAPVISMTIPDDWKPEETETGIQATSPDSAIYLSADLADSSSMDKVVTDAIDFLQKNGVTVDTSTQKETPVTEVNGLQITTLDWDGKDADGPVSIGLGFVVATPEKALVLTYWGTKGDEDKHDKEVQDIVMSIKPVN